MSEKSRAPTEVHELELLERVFLRLGAAESDEQLEKTLARFLVPVILKINSEHKTVQNKVLELLTHVSKRLKSRPLVQLPLDMLLSQFGDPEAPPQVVNFSLVYLRMGFPRLPGSEQGRLLPTLVQSLQGKTVQQQEGVLQLCIPALVHLVLPQDLSKRQSLFSLEGKGPIRTTLLDFTLHYLLLPYRDVDVQTTATHPPPPGLSSALVSKVTGGNFPAPDQLEKVKLAIVQLLSSEIFTPDEVICHFMVAAGDPRNSVSDQGDHHLRVFGGNVDWEKAPLISRLFSLYQGTVATPGKKNKPQPAPQEHRSPVTLRVRLRIMPYLLKSTLAANSFPATMQVVFDSLFGEITNTKLRSLTLQFIYHICSSTSEQKLTVMAPVLLTGLNKIVDQPEEEPRLQVMAYTGIGSLAQRVPLLFRKDTKHLRKLFEALKKDTAQDIGLAIQECLRLMSAAYKGVQGQNAVIVEALLLENIYSPVSRVRLAAVQYGSTVFPFDHIPSRFVCVIGAGDSEDNVREEGRRGLKPPLLEEGRYQDSADPPDFCKMVSYLHKRASLSLQSETCYTTAAGTLPFAPPSLSEGLAFLRLCLAFSAGVTEEQELTNQTLPTLAEYLSKLAESSDKEVFSQYLELLKQSLGPAGDAGLYSVAMAALLEAVAASPTDVAIELSKEIDWIRGFTRSSRPETREPAGKLLGLLSGLLEDKPFLTLADQVLTDTWSESYNVQHGAVISLGYVVGSCLNQHEPHEHGDNTMDTRSGEKDELVKRALQRLIDLVSSVTTVQLACSACGALGEIVRRGPLPLPNTKGEEEREEKKEERKEEEKEEKKEEEKGEEKEEKKEERKEEEKEEKKEEEKEEEKEEKKEEKKKEGTEGILLKTSVMECLKKKLRSAKEIKLKEHCAHSLGSLAVGDPSFPEKHSLLRGLFQVREEKAIELQFTVGEAISCVAAGRLSTASHDPWQLPSHEEKSTTVVDADIMSWTLDTIITEFTVGVSPLVRQAACVWLLSILKHAWKHPGIQGFMKRIQITFMNMLAETSDVTQEVASRGLGLVYEHSDSSQRESLVKILVGTLMEGRKPGQEVTGDTKIFQEGMLGKTPQGGNLSTYKELCSLASDLNQPDLIYKFMHLANHHSLWNSKKGAAFGFSTIASQAQEQLAPYLPTLVPRLYRYKYDPIPRIQLAMSSIWSTLVPDSKKAVDTYLGPILNDLIANINGSIWRNREASCIALSDLLVGRQVGEIADYLPQLWELCLRARDDIKESVRKAADIACRALHKATTRACDSSTMDKTGARVVEVVLPLLLHKGMSNPAQEVRAISLLAILKISENAGPLLKPHISLLVPTLLESLSSLEPQVLNTWSLQLSGEGDVQEKLEDIRVAVSRSSPMMEAINLCVPHVDSTVLTALIPKLVDVLKSGVGLGTKVASAQFVTSLVHHCLQDLTPHAGKLLNTLVSGLSDRSAGVRKAYAKTIGHLVKVAKDSSITKFIGKLRGWYFEKDDTSIKSSIAHVFHAVAVHSPDTGRNAGSEFLPLVFLAMHAKTDKDDPTSEAIVKMWEDTWGELVPGTESGIRLYLSELMEIVCPALEAQSWPIKAQGAAAIATIAEKMGGSLSPSHLATLLNTLLGALQGRTWEGKEVLLKALGTVCVSCKSALLNPQDPNQPTTDKVTQTLLGQCRKRTLGYKAVAIATTGEVVDTLGVDIFAEFSDILFPLLTTDHSSGGDEEEEEDRRASVEARHEVQVKAYLALGQAWPHLASTQGQFFDRVLTVLSTALVVNTWKLQVAILSTLHTIFGRLVTEVSPKSLAFLASEMVPAVCKCLGNVRYSVVRQKALQALDKLTLCLQGQGCLHSYPEKDLSTLRSSLSSVSDPQLKELARTILNRTM